MKVVRRQKPSCVGRSRFVRIKDKATEMVRKRERLREGLWPRRRKVCRRRDERQEERQLTTRVETTASHLGKDEGVNLLSRSNREDRIKIVKAKTWKKGLGRTSVSPGECPSHPDRGCNRWGSTKEQVQTGQEIGST